MSAEKAGPASYSSKSFLNDMGIEDFTPAPPSRDEQIDQMIRNLKSGAVGAKFAHPNQPKTRSRYDQIFDGALIDISTLVSAGVATKNGIVSSCITPALYGKLHPSYKGKIALVISGLRQAMEANPPEPGAPTAYQIIFPPEPGFSDMDPVFVRFDADGFTFMTEEDYRG